MAVYVSNIVINSGTTFSETFTLESASTSAAFDLSGYSGAAQMRKHSGASTKTDFTVDFQEPLTSGQIVLSLTADQTTGLKPGRYVYDIVITKDANKQTVVEGNVLVREGVTR